MPLEVIQESGELFQKFFRPHQVFLATHSLLQDTTNQSAYEFIHETFIHFVSLANRLFDLDPGLCAKKFMVTQVLAVFHRLFPSNTQLRVASLLYRVSTHADFNSHVTLSNWFSGFRHLIRKSWIHSNGPSSKECKMNKLNKTRMLVDWIPVHLILKAQTDEDLLLEFGPRVRRFPKIFVHETSELSLLLSNVQCCCQQLIWMKNFHCIRLYFFPCLLWTRSSSEFPDLDIDNGCVSVKNYARTCVVIFTLRGSFWHFENSSNFDDDF